MWDLLQTSDWGFAFASNPFFKVDAAGNKQWELSLGNLTAVYSVIQTQNGGYAIAGAASANGASEGWMSVIGSTNLTPNNLPTPTVPEFSWLMILPSFFSILAIAVLIRKRRVS